MRKALLVLLAVAAAAMWKPQFIQCSMSIDGILDLFMKGNTVRYSIPRVIVFDGDGNEVGATTGYGPHVTAAIQSAVRKHGQAGGYTLAMLAATLTTEDGKPLDIAPLKGQPVIAELGADWCAPCRQLRSDLHRGTGANVLEIDADMQKHSKEMHDALKKRLDKIKAAANGNAVN